MNSGEGHGSGDNLTSCWLYYISQCFSFTLLNVFLRVNHCNLSACGWHQGTAYMQFQFYSLKRVTPFLSANTSFCPFCLCTHSVTHKHARARTHAPPRWRPWGSSCISRPEMEVRLTGSEMDCKVLGLLDTCGSSKGPLQRMNQL